MKLLLPVLLAFSALHAGSTSLENYLSAVEASPAAKAEAAKAASQSAAQRAQVQTSGFFLNGELGYAAEKKSDRDALEYHVSLEKQLNFANSSDYVDALSLSLQQQQTLQQNRLKTIIYEHYVDACTLQEKAGLLRDAQDRNRELTKLIRTGVKGGEFDRSALLRSELIVDELQLRIQALESQYFAALKQLQLYAQNGGEPLCQDLPFSVPLDEELESNSLLYRYLESEIRAASAMQNFSDATFRDLSVGVGYDNEIDLTRGIVFMQIPLNPGSRRNSEREAASQAKLAAQQQLVFTQQEIRAQIESYVEAQQSRHKSYQRLNDILIPKAYETSVLLLERFMGSEGSYLEYIDSQKALFDLLLQGIDTRAQTLSAQARIYRTLGIDPNKETK